MPISLLLVKADNIAFGILRIDKALMKNSLIYKLAIAASLSVVAVSCAPSAPTVSTTPNATATTPPASPTVSATTSPTATPSPTASAKPTESPTASTTDKAPDTVRVAVVNNSGKELKAIYMSPPTKQDWGKNELDAPLPDREKADFEWKRSDYTGVEAGCLFEVRAEYADGKSSDLDEIDLCKTPAINLK
jgi:hypothetical protein